MGPRPFCGEGWVCDVGSFEACRGWEASWRQVEHGAEEGVSAVEMGCEGGVRSKRDCG